MCIRDSNRACLKDVVAKLTGIVRCVQHQKGHKEHSLVAALDVYKRQSLRTVAPITAAKLWATDGFSAITNLC